LIEITTVRGIPDTEFSPAFVQGMHDRMDVSYCKYGAVAEAYPARVDAIASLKKRLERYEQDGNTEWLMDVANFAMIEFMHPRHPNAHFDATDADRSPGRVWNSGSETDAANTTSRENQRRGGSDRTTAGGFYSREGD
jgi:hypothetical protein